MVAPLDVNPGELSAAGDKLSAGGDRLVAALSALTSGIAGVNAGHDGAGVHFGTEYLNAGRGVLGAGSAAVNACRRMAYGIKMSAYNYALSNAMSIPGGGQPSLSIPPCPAAQQAPAMASPFGPGVAAPVLWTIVEAFVGEVWPDGNPASLRAASGAWTTYGGALSQASGDIAATKRLYADQHLPEADLISAAIDQLSHNVGSVADQCRQIAASLTSFADKVEATQEAIRDLLKRLNPMGMVGLAVSLFKDGDPLATIRAVANDIKAVLNHMKDEADAAQWAFTQAMNGLDPATDSLQRWVSKEFPTVAPVLNGYIDIENGVIHSAADAVHGVSELDPRRIFYDPQGARESWKAAVDTAGMFVPPILAVQLATDTQGVIDRGKGLVDSEDWSGDHPLRGLGHNIGDIAQFFIPGIGEAKVAETAAETSARAGEAAAGVESKLGSTEHDGAGLIGRAGQAGGDIGARASKVASDLDQIKTPGHRATQTAGGSRAAATCCDNQRASGRSSAAHPARHAGRRSQADPGTAGATGGASRWPRTRATDPPVVHGACAGRLAPTDRTSAHTGGRACTHFPCAQRAHVGAVDRTGAPCTRPRGVS